MNAWQLVSITTRVMRARSPNTVLTSRGSLFADGMSLGNETRRRSSTVLTTKCGDKCLNSPADWACNSHDQDDSYLPNTPPEKNRIPHDRRGSGYDNPIIFHATPSWTLTLASRYTISNVASTSLLTYSLPIKDGSSPSGT